MPKNIFQDIIPSEKSIRRIPIPPRRVSSAPARKTRELEEENFESEQPKKAGRKSSRNYSGSNSGRSYTKMAIWSIAIACFIFLAFSVSALFAKARVKITPKTDSVAVDLSLKASKDAPAGSISFEIEKINAEVSIEVSSSGQVSANTKAQGKAIIYNTTSKSQKLLNGTRLETPAGLVFKTVQTVTVPAAKVSAGKTTPGSVEVSIEASEAGEKYNVGLSDFTIPGFKGTAKFTAIYGRTKAPVAGGFVGVKNTVSKADLEKAKASLEQKIKEKLSKDLLAQKPENFLFYPDAVNFSFDASPEILAATASSTGKTATIREKGTAYAAILDRESFEQAVISKTVKNPDGNITVSNLEKLNFSLKDKEKLGDSTTEISFALQGDANLLWSFDKNTVASELAGKPKSQTDSILAKYKVIETSVVVQPFWKTDFPASPEKITVEMSVPASDEKPSAH